MMLLNSDMDIWLLEIMDKLQRNAHLNANGTCILWTCPVFKDKHGMFKINFFLK